VIDVFEAAGLQVPDISLLSDDFLADVRDLPQKSLAVELLQRLMNDEIRLRARTNVVESKEVLAGARGIADAPPDAGNH
jgi:type I restriction enzyme R subunit